MLRALDLPTRLGGVKRWLLAMLALALRVAAVPLRAFDSASASWRLSGVGTKGVPVPSLRSAFDVPAARRTKGKS